MHRITELLLTDLRLLVADLGADGGLMGPSIYDTAQVMRLAPPPEGSAPALEWLIGQQQPDGGWGNPAVPRGRDVPTLAALLAIHAAGQTACSSEATLRGLAFLCGQAQHWAAPLPDDLPVGVELLLPRLLQEADAAGLRVPRQQYAALIELGARRRRLIAGLTLRPGTTPVHSWEALGLQPDPALQDPTGSIGHSPAATAAWLSAAAGRPELAARAEAARAYLAGAAAVTGTGVPGVVPTAWPITRFEQAFGLYALLIAGLLHHPALADVVRPQLDQLERALTPAGIGFSDHFVADGDDTAALVAVLQAAGRLVDTRSLTRYAHAEHYLTYPGELQPSVTATAHATHALGLLGLDASRPQAYLRSRQLPDGSWTGEKWNGSWLYPTSRTLVALCDTPEHEAVRGGLEALASFQRADGGWGTCHSNPEETAYGVLGLWACLEHPTFGPPARGALERGKRWLLQNYRPFGDNRHRFWLAKENYRPERLARVIELSATLVQIDDEQMCALGTARRGQYA